MTKRSLWPAIILASVIAFVAGGLVTAGVMVGPWGFRQVAQRSPSPIASLNHPSPTPSGSPVATGPGRRVYAAMAFDAATGKMMLFGGLAGTSDTDAYGGVNPSADTWAWDGKKWSQELLTAGPIPRFGADTAYDPVRQVIVMRGGVSPSGVFVCPAACGYLNETWTWNGSRWLLMNPSQSPPNWDFAPADQPVVWDSVHQRLLLFDFTRFQYGGAYNVPDLNQSWAWDGSNWARLQSSGSAPAAHGTHPSGLAFDSARGVLVFFGHVGNNAMTWTFDGSAWKVASTSGPSDLSFTMAYDEARSQVVLFGQTGQTWTWDGSSWTARNPVHAPAPRVGVAMAYDSARHVLMLFGGASSDDFFWNTVLYGTTWTWDGNDWTMVA